MQNNRVRTNSMGKSSFSLGRIAHGMHEWVRNVLTTRKGAYPSHQEDRKVESANSETADSDAKFLGWQKRPTGEPIALYNVMAEQHPLFHSTVSEKTLREQNLAIPPTPPQQKEGEGFDLD